MTEEKKNFIHVEDLLPEGFHLLRVKKHPEFEDKQPVADSHMTGKSQYGNWYMYDTKLKTKVMNTETNVEEEKEIWVSLFANDENKAGFDTGFIKANIVPKRAQGNKTDDIFDSNGKKLLKAFYNVLSPAEFEIAKKNLIEGNAKPQEVVAKTEGLPPITGDEEEIDIEKIPF